MSDDSQQRHLSLLYPLADVLQVRLGLYANKKEGRYDIVNIPGGKGLDIQLGPVSINLPMEVKASFCHEGGHGHMPVAGIWVKILKALYVYLVHDPQRQKVFCHVVDCDKLGGGTPDLHKKFKGQHPLMVLEKIRQKNALVRCYARDRYGDLWAEGGAYDDFDTGDGASESDSVDTGQTGVIDEGVGEDTSSIEGQVSRSD